MYNIEIIFLYSLAFNANICFNKKNCKNRNITSQYFKPLRLQSLQEKKKPKNVRIRDEIKFLLKKTKTKTKTKNKQTKQKTQKTWISNFISSIYN